MDKINKVEETAEIEEPIFQQVHFTKSGINFINVVREDETHNFFNYNYIYNGAGLAVGDFNNDDLQDVIFVSNQSKNRLFINQGELNFENISETAGIESDGGWKNGVTVIDVNQDGLDDIYLSKSGRYDDPKMRAN
ncbi:MAG TPA: VCBS repeat-containing protein, partial [Roseivirga sp.]